MKKTLSILLLTALVVVPFYVINKAAHAWLPKWVDILVGFPVSLFVMYLILIRIAK